MPKRQTACLQGITKNTTVRKRTHRSLTQPLSIFSIGNANSKTSSLALLRGYLNGSVHAFNNGVANAQSQARALRKTVHLKETLEYMFLVIFGDANARIFHKERDKPGLVEVVPHGDGAFFGELRRIVNEVVEYLFEPYRVGQYLFLLMQGYIFKQRHRRWYVEPL